MRRLQATIVDRKMDEENSFCATVAKVRGPVVDVANKNGGRCTPHDAIDGGRVAFRSAASI